MGIATLLIDLALRLGGLARSFLAPQQQPVPIPVRVRERRRSGDR